MHRKTPRMSKLSQVSFKETLQNAATHAFGKKGKSKSDWFDENDLEIRTLLKDKHLNRRDIRKSIRAMKNDWFTNKAKQAETFYQQKKHSEFYAIIREVHGPKTRNSNQIKSRQGRLLTTPHEFKDRWVEHFYDLLNISAETNERT